MSSETPFYPGTTLTRCEHCGRICANESALKSHKFEACTEIDDYEVEYDR